MMSFCFFDVVVIYMNGILSPWFIEAFSSSFSSTSLSYSTSSSTSSLYYIINKSKFNLSLFNNITVQLVTHSEKMRCLSHTKKKGREANAFKTWLKILWNFRHLTTATIRENEWWKIKKNETLASENCFLFHIGGKSYCSLLRN